MNFLLDSTAGYKNQVGTQVSDLINLSKKTVIRGYPDNQMLY